MAMVSRTAGQAVAPPYPEPFDRLLCRAELLAAFAPLVGDLEACLELTADLDPEDAERALASRLVTYWRTLGDALALAVPAGRWAA